MKATAPTAAVNSIRVTKAKAAYHIRLYLAPEVLETERQEQRESRGGGEETKNVNRA